MPAPHPNPAVRALKAARGLALRAAATHLLPEDVMFLRGPSSDDGARRVALTFDDGPHELTGRYLEVLAKAGAKATFFVVGRACTEHPGAVDAIARAGHEVAGHGFTHTEFPKLRADELKGELERTAALLPKPAGGRGMVRPPRGIVTPRSLLGCFRAGYTSAMWSHDTLDWDARTADEVLRRVRPEEITPGESILMHEGKPWTLEALPRVLEGLQTAGFELVTISALLAS
jgi:peptidoglycan/xylan/chitin deacetylase (PgdA/CDA1 family)